ncbi:MAG TPA: HRDC domain-containing protein [Thermoanaerobaculia bacterium]|nr:HRDC domain-containing protein [Thermoanaerobaculia bacterium]
MWRAFPAFTHPALRRHLLPAGRGEGTGEYDRALFEALRVWRRAESQERGVPPYVIFSDRTLRELARARPSTLYELRGIYGIGDAKLEAFGSAVISVITQSALPTAETI